MRRWGIALLGTVALAGCGTAGGKGGGGNGINASNPDAGQTPVLRGHPQVVEPVAGAAGSASAPGPSSVGVVSGQSSGGLAQPVSDAQVRAELQQSGLTANPDQAELTPQGLAIAPINAPPAVQAVINAGNEIAHLPYRFGGGHGTFEDTAYDCSGSISFVFAAAGLLATTTTSGELEQWGAAGPGHWITVFANAGHTFMYVAGLRFDTVALAQTGSRWSNRSATEGGGFAVRHPLGL
jgi:hypothetical protein